MTRAPKKAPGKTVAVRKPAPITKKAPAKNVASQKAEVVTVDLSQRVEVARALGFSRRFLTDESGLTGTTALWRANRMGEAEAAKLAALLVKIETGKIAAPVRRVAGSPRAPVPPRPNWRTSWTRPQSCWPPRRPRRPSRVPAG
jgi:hypothetical protein